MSSPSSSEAAAFTIGDRVKLSLVREIESDDPMHDLFHVHGAGRFVLFARDGIPEANVWKDTVLSAGETVGIPLVVTKPGWVDGPQSYRRASRERMMLGFDVLPANAA